MFNIHYIKVPKTGSTSIKDALIYYCKDNKINYINKTPSNIQDHKDKIGASLGHLPYTPKYVSLLNNLFIEGNKTLVIGSVREPLERAISNMNYTNGGDFNKNYLRIKQLKSWNVSHDNIMSYYLGFDTLESISKESIKEKFDFVVVLEDYENSMKQLGAILDYDFEVLKLNQRRKNDISNISDNVKSEFKKRNELDYKLYNLCKELYG